MILIHFITFSKELQFASVNNNKKLHSADTLESKEIKGKKQRKITVCRIYITGFF